VANTFAYRCTDQRGLIKVDDPVGPENDEHIIQMAKDAVIVIFAYGKPKHKVNPGRQTRETTTISSLP
jgi:hypothetical protein